LGGRGRWISEFEASLVYRVSSRTARATQRNPVSKKQKTKQKKERQKKKKKKRKKNSLELCTVMETVNTTELYTR
jgi:Zn-dependent peptidase ImmA (M78 family)